MKTKVTVSPDHPTDKTPIHFFNEDELCAYLGKSKAWAQRARFEGTGPRYVKAGRKPLYPFEFVNEWLMDSARENTIDPKSNHRAA